jgi:hypothetical protein
MTSEGYLIPAILAICFNEIEERGKVRWLRKYIKKKERIQLRRKTMF